MLAHEGRHSITPILKEVRIGFFPLALSFLTTLFPRNPVAPVTTIFMLYNVFYIIQNSETTRFEIVVLSHSFYITSHHFGD